MKINKKLKKPDYIGYRNDKRTIENIPMQPREYEAIVKEFARRRGIWVCRIYPYNIYLLQSYS